MSSVTNQLKRKSEISHECTKTMNGAGRKNLFYIVFIKITRFLLQNIFSWYQPQLVKLNKEFTIRVLITEHFFNNIFSSDTPSSFQPLPLASISWCMIVWTLKYWEKESTNGGKLMATIQQTSNVRCMVDISTWLRKSSTSKIFLVDTDSRSHKGLWRQVLTAPNQLLVNQTLYFIYPVYFSYMMGI